MALVKYQRSLQKTAETLPEEKWSQSLPTRIETAKPFAEKFDIPNYYDDWKKLLERDDIENIYIGSPHTLHKDMVINCLKAGKNILCEKPMGVNAGEVREMLAAAKESGKLLMEAMWSVFFPSLQRVKEMIKTNELGPLHTVYTNMGYGGTKTRERWRYYNEMAGGGLLDIGIYPIHALRYLFDKMPDKYKSFAKIENDVDVYSSILMEFNDTLCTCTQTSYNDVDNFAAFYFDKGVVRLNDRWFCSDTMIISEPGKQPRTEAFPFKRSGYAVRDCGLRRSR